MIPQIDYIIIGKSKLGKTLIKHVVCNNTMLGVIKWYSQWRRYVFYPEINTLFDDKCLENIRYHLERMTYEHKNND